MRDEELRAARPGAWLWPYFAATTLLEPAEEAATVCGLIVWFAVLAAFIGLAVLDVAMFGPLTVNLQVNALVRVACKAVTEVRTMASSMGVAFLTRGFDRILRLVFGRRLLQRHLRRRLTNVGRVLLGVCLTMSSYLPQVVFRMPAYLFYFAKYSAVLCVLNSEFANTPFTKGQLARAFLGVAQSILRVSGRGARQHRRWWIWPWPLSLLCWGLFLRHRITSNDDHAWNETRTPSWHGWAQDQAWVASNDKCLGCVARFVDCTDGDTCRPDQIWANAGTSALPPLSVASIRIRGIDTPEKRGSCDIERCLANHAKQALNQFVLQGAPARKRRLIECGHDKFFRYVCDILDDDGNRASDEMLELGLAMPWNGRGGRPLDWCAAPPSKIPPQVRSWLVACADSLQRNAAS